MFLRKAVPEPFLPLYDRVTFKFLYPLPYKIAYLRKRISLSPKKKVLFYPEKPKPQHIAYKICHVLGYDIVGNPIEKSDTIISFEDTTFRKSNKTLLSLSKEKKVLNLNCRDISKENVEKVFKKVFGYGLIINPLTFRGKYVRKSNKNYAHDGKVFTKPQKPEKGYVYQKVINNQYGKLVQDIRTPVINGIIPFVYYKYRSIEDRFSNTNIQAKMVKTEKAFTKGEVKKIVTFALEMGLHWGELDILRDRDTKRIYIVDVNNTPAGTPNHISKEEHQLALKILSETFRQAFLS